ncbi:hypothetical protein B0T26DRAFT_793942 [Lasiosphaeria miniovina]|uniref:Uncharacterized protein n=1 Tax=Lasiosphaeria miniovina TaxID=1954250 RepID=A0AA39ZU70_9PEZI|nr:uncharacterized protein B0T26DRAFT_793942 [Lasiosphaeria miniovina]KAK0703816.1 hypothetical protein B0T26DRAFT_793942 [Lasiosphaeria miniovina]
MLILESWRWQVTRYTAVTDQEFPGKESIMTNPKSLFDELPTDDGKIQEYKAAGKLEGKNATITGRDSSISRETKRRVEQHGRKCYLFPTDITDREDCRKVVDEAMMVEDIKGLDEDQWLHAFNTNIHPIFYLSNTIINNASINAYTSRPDPLDYTSTKGAIVSFTRGLSNQQVGKGIRAKAIAPGPVWTPLIPATMTNGAKKQFTAPMGRPAQPSEIATCVVFLAAADSSCISGQTIHCNGGTIVSG